MMMQGIASNASQKPLQNHYFEMEALIYQNGLRSPKPHIQVRFLAGAPACYMAGTWFHLEGHCQTAFPETFATRVLICLCA
jgi:hypothetical protein